MNSPNPFDPATFKAAARRQWDHCADGWDAHGPVLREWLRQATDTMLAMAGVQPGARVLDVAAGAGEQTLDIARRVGPTGRVLAIDFSPELVACARRHVQQAGLSQVELMVGDAEALPLDDASIDAAVCRLGLMLLPDPPQALRELHRVCRPGAGVCTLVFGRPEHNPCVTLLLATALEHAGAAPRRPDVPGGLLSLGAPGRADALFREAGFHDVASTTISAPFRLPSARHYLAFVRSAASPVTQILAGLDAQAAHAAWDDMAQRLARFDTAEGWVGPNELLLTAARR